MRHRDLRKNQKVIGYRFWINGRSDSSVVDYECKLQIINLEVKDFGDSMLAAAESGTTNDMTYYQEKIAQLKALGLHSCKVLDRYWKTPESIRIHWQAQHKDYRGDHNSDPKWYNARVQAHIDPWICKLLNHIAKKTEHICSAFVTPKDVLDAIGAFNEVKTCKAHPVKWIDCGYVIDEEPDYTVRQLTYVKAEEPEPEQTAEETETAEAATC